MSIQSSPEELSRLKMLNLELLSVTFNLLPSNLSQIIDMSIIDNLKGISPFHYFLSLIQIELFLEKREKTLCISALIRKSKGRVSSKGCLIPQGRVL